MEFCALTYHGFLGLFNNGDPIKTETGYHANDVRINAGGTYSAHFDHWVGGCAAGLLYEHEHDQGYGSWEYAQGRMDGRVTN